MSRLSLLAVVSAVVLSTPMGSGATPSTTLPSNGRIAFFDVTGIASMNPDGSGQWGVELNVGDTQPAWSPDGTRLAVVTHWAGNNGILVMQPDGSLAHLVTTQWQDGGPAWSPDGTQLAFVSAGDLVAVNADGTGRHLLATVAGGWLSRPTWSPDGTRIAFGASTPDVGTTGIDIYDVTKRTVTTVLDSTRLPYAQNPAWSPDGSRIAFTSSSAIYAMNADGTSPSQLTAANVYDDQPAWSPDGRQIAFTRNSQIWVMQTDGSGAHQLTTGDANGWPAWQPLGPAPQGCSLWGTAADDLLVGTEGNDVICGGGGNDTVLGLGGSDVLRGGDGNDWLAGGTGLDYLDAGAGADRLDGRDGGESDHLVGGPGIDAGTIDGTIDRTRGVERPRVDANLAAWRPTTASNYEPTNPPVRAVDGQTSDWWNSGNYPGQWLEVDLGRPRQIARVSLITMEYPGGSSILLLGRATSDDTFHLLHAFRGPMADLQQVAFAPKKAWRNVRYLRLYIPQVYAPVGWVAWHEMSVYGPKPRAPKRGG